VVKLPFECVEVLDTSPVEELLMNPRTASTPDEDAKEVQPPSRVRVLKRPSRLFGTDPEFETRSGSRGTSTARAG
jgi:hypothetical protein